MLGNQPMTHLSRDPADEATEQENYEVRLTGGALCCRVGNEQSGEELNALVRSPLSVCHAW